jgi:hypothetical protein
MMRRLLTIATLAAALCVAARAPALAAPSTDDADYVRDVVGRAAAHVEAGRYDEALAVLDQAEHERSLPVFVYVRATIEERRGDCERAVALYREFLELEVAAEDAEDARQGVTRCGGEPEPEPVSPPDPVLPDPAPVDEPVSEPASPAAPPPRRWYADPTGDVLVAAGVVGLGVGFGLFGQSRADARAAADAGSLQTFDDRSHRAVTLDRAGLATIAVGSALVLGGAIRWAVVGTRDRDRRRVAIVPGGSRRGAIVQLTAWF